MAVEGTTDNAAGSVTGGAAASGSTGNVTSGTASEAMIKAATAASSAESIPTGQVGDTAATGQPNKVVATSDATGQPDAVATAAAAAKAGEAPPARIEAAVKNARAEVEAKYEAFKGLDASDAHIAYNLLADIRRDPQNFLQRLQLELKPAEKEVPEQFPAPSLVSQDGAKAYSDTDILKIIEITKKQIMGELRPDLEYVRSSKTAGAEAEARQQREAALGESMKEARTRPHFTENEPKIAEILKAMDPAMKRRLGPMGAVYAAYNQMLEQVVFPSMQTKAEEAVRAANLKKAHTSAGQAHPTEQGGEGKTPQLRGVDDLAKHMERLEAAATA